MKKFSLSLVLGLIVNNVVSSLIAMLVLNPLLNPMFKGTVRSQEAGLEMPSILGGYFILTLVMVLGYKYFSFKGDWLKKGAVYGLMFGIVTFVSGHMIVAGWADIPPLPMLISGILDTLAPVLAGVVIAYFYRNE